MGVWDFMRKMAQGKPIFEEPPSQQGDNRRAGWAEESPQSEENSPPFVDARGEKIIPRISITRCKSHLNGDHMDVTAWLTNTSSYELELDQMTMLDMRTDVTRHLRPGEGHEVTLYRGTVLTHDHAHKAQLYYKIVQNGDNFCADFTIEFNRESDGRFTVEELRPEHDIVHDV